MNRIRVVLADDHSLVRDGLRSLSRRNRPRSSIAREKVSGDSSDVESTSPPGGDCPAGRKA